MVVGHGIIPHCHHDIVLFTAGEKYVHHFYATYSHGKEEPHHHGTPAEGSEKQGHSAPFHFHTSIVHGYDFLKIKRYCHNTVFFELHAFPNNVVLLNLIPPPVFEDLKFTEFPLIIPPEPASVNALLRAPPFLLNHV